MDNKNALVLKAISAVFFAIFSFYHIYYIYNYSADGGIYTFTSFLLLISALLMIVGLFYKRLILGIGLIALGVTSVIEILSYGDIDSFELLSMSLTALISVGLGAVFASAPLYKTIKKYFLGVIIIAAIPLIAYFIMSIHFYNDSYFESFVEYIGEINTLFFYSSVALRVGFIIIAVLIGFDESDLPHSNVISEINAFQRNDSQISSTVTVTNERTVEHNAPQKNNKGVFCAFCGTSLEPGAVFCHNCGKKRVE